MRWSFVVFAACSSSSPRPTTPEPITAPAIDAAPVVVEAPPPDPTAVIAGAQLFDQRGCKICHDPSVTDKKGGPLQGLWGTEVELADGTKATFDEAYVRESIVEPTKKLRAGYPAVMPAYPIFTDDEMTQIIAYIRSLR